ncbi:hypothetical protein RKT74_14175 [Leclercia pneumoniae]|nr:hypothetical protein [Leclercia pneumoniae]MCE6963749.1 hypothetical protein [Enterobacter sp. MW07]MCV2513736.1 hypothetical protein [Leclercia pneumoniae]WNN79864.1 hypothetical protein RKT74_14175 [Leclercia pneumoniae]
MLCIAGVIASNAASVHDYLLAARHPGGYDDVCQPVMPHFIGGVRYHVRE